MDHYATKRKAWAHTQSLFAVRVCGMQPSGKFPATPFPAQEVADATELPYSSRREVHERAFADLKAKFEQRWSEWAGREELEKLA